MAKIQTTQWPKDRQHNGQEKKDNKTNNDRQNTTDKLYCLSIIVWQLEMTWLTAIENDYGYVPLV
jgi:hypothetical protein